MGTWGPGGFENDEAADWAAAVASTDDVAAVFDGLPDDPTEEIEAEQAQRVVAAAECVAALMGRPSGDLPDALEATLAGLAAADPSLVEAARNALSRILGWSELTALWAEADPAPFNLAMTALIERLNPEIPFKPVARERSKAVRQTCGFCDGEIEEADLVSIEIRQETDPVNRLSRGFWCHLACLNARLHPGHIVQNWKFDPEEVEKQAERLLKDSLKDD